MNIVNFQCGLCGKLMAVSAEYLGAQVHCPHCMGIVQAPPPPAGPPSEIPLKVPDVRDQDSIFGNPEEVLSEDLFGAPSPPLLEVPPASVPSLPRESNWVQPSAGNLPAAAQTRPPTPPAVPAVPEISLPPAREAVVEAAAPAEPGSELPRPEVSLRHSGSGMLVPILLIFLIPYSIFSTAYIIWNLVNPPRGSFDPLERLPDNKMRDGGPVRVDPHAPLPSKLKTSLNQAIRVGDVEVIPLKISLNGEGDLVLHLKMLNTSADLAFNPLPDSFVRYSETSQKALRPYTFLEGGPQRNKLYGGYLKWFKGPAGRQKESDGIIRPGEEVFIQLTTYDKYRDTLVKEALRSPRPLLWRIHVRRGFLAVRDRQVSATAVIGVEFSSGAIEKEKG